MSKAFTRESDDVPERPSRPRPTQPAGAKNYLTQDGAQRFREELDHLTQTERPRLAAVAGDDAPRRPQLADQRIQQLQHILHTAVVVPPPAGPPDRVRFGVTVTVREATGDESRYRIVGVDETDLDRGWVSCHSPIAKALLNARLGQRVRFKFPSGEAELEIIALE